LTLIVSFPGIKQTILAEVGGKGYSLIRMIEAGLPVPPGAVLTTEFFAPWLDEIQASAAWTALPNATPDQWVPVRKIQLVDSEKKSFRSPRIQSFPSCGT